MIQDKYIEFEYDYEKFVHYLFSIEKYLDGVTVNEICQVFKSNIIEPEKQIEFDEFDNELEPEDYLFVPKQNESLSQAVKEKGWINDNIEQEIVNSYYYKGLFKENQKLELSIINDITQNSLHILGRCNNPKNSVYKYYGGKGITICPKWNKSFISFWGDMKDGYSDQFSIDRIDNNKGYCKENCKWSTRRQQAINNSRNVVFNGECASQASERLGGHKSLVRDRIYSGWSKEKAFTTPIKKQKPKKQVEKSEKSVNNNKTRTFSMFWGLIKFNY
jgi:hypothetical protein